MNGDLSQFSFKMTFLDFDMTGESVFLHVLLVLVNIKALFGLLETQCSAVGWRSEWRSKLIDFQDDLFGYKMTERLVFLHVMLVFSNIKVPFGSLETQMKCSWVEK